MAETVQVNWRGKSKNHLSVGIDFPYVDEDLYASALHIIYVVYTSL